MEKPEETLHYRIVRDLALDAQSNLGQLDRIVERLNKLDTLMNTPLVQSLRKKRDDLIEKHVNKIHDNIRRSLNKSELAFYYSNVIRLINSARAELNDLSSGMYRVNEFYFYNIPKITDPDAYIDKLTAMYNQLDNAINSVKTNKE